MDERDSLQLYRTLAENFPNGAVLLFDRNLRYRLADGKGLAEAGLSKEALEGKTIWELFPPDVCALLEPHYRSALAGESRVAEIPFNRQTYEVHASPVRDSGGNIVFGMVMTQNITERKDAENALRLSEELFSKTFNLSPYRMGIIRIRDGVILEVNECWLRETGFSRSEVINRLVHELNLWLPDTLRDLVRKVLLQGESFYGLEGSMMTRSGEHRVVMASAEVVQINGEACFLWAANDITERKQAEDALAASERRFSKAFNSIPVLGTISSLDTGHFLSVNDRFISTTGYSREEAVGRTALELQLWPNPEDRRRVMETLKRDGRVKSHEACVRMKNGQERMLLLSIEQIELEGQQCLLHAANDITLRKNAEQALANSEERYRTLFEMAPDAVAVLDADLRIIMANRQGIKLYGFGPDDQVGGMRADDLIPVGERPRVRAFFRSVAETGRSVTFEHTGLKRDGTEFHVETRVSRFQDGDAPAKFLGVSLDITDRKRAEQALRVSEQQLRALSARIQSAREEEGTRIAREIHDELGGALTGIKWDLEALESALAESEGQTSSKTRQRIKAMTSLIESTINTVRRISSELRPGVLDDLGLVAALEWQAQQIQARTGMHYVSDTTLETVALERDSATAVFRIFQEILTNVLRHAQATAFHVAQRIDGDIFELKVTDNGRGITDEEKRNTRSLGLLGMMERALLVGGTVDISGGKGGTTVVVRVPIKRH